MKGKKIVCTLGAIVSISAAFYINNLYDAYSGDKRVHEMMNESELERAVIEKGSVINSENYFLLDKVVENEKLKVKLKDAFIIDECVFIGFEYDANLLPEDFKADEEMMYKSRVDGKLFSIEPQEIEIVSGEEKLNIITDSMRQMYNKQMLTILGGSDKIADNFCKTKGIVGFKLPKDYKEGSEIKINLSNFLFEGNTVGNELKLPDNFNTSISFSLNGIKKEEPIVQKVNTKYTLEKDGFEILEYKDYGMFAELSLKIKDKESELPKIALITDTNMKGATSKFSEDDKMIYLFEKGNANVVAIYT